ncbi:phosphatidylglycerophosphatase A family protein [Laribacter hongkongensis]|uniref:Phosphatidylglycerophosphatase A n=1 Tax=Laribacter hongkongensis TaxID=168471 RepID=A0A248LLG1_9NEIS|nr:phosphatidylglycerophosphatase A [Laribacter hongkongensis]ASJ25284.1 phosphatidylglycerophosphatase A [Laribacter hongkongensis]MCG9040681.1 phosphatidylglycerophosphatase A [Laribacter hongkongensis]MCG9066985.1 phosphatidylglycerophosphatase A [Laribacter hongkongensis]MCG9088409.1 phosphatidylglycerophosphatase A [Laribacter hongkongensis]MCG9108958.1 phosphatidylglycerophosphatase A [Laribacter hongkongensis]
MTTLPEVNARFVFARVYRVVAFGFGSGLIRPAPGTWGSLVALPLYGLLYWLGLSPLMVALLCVPLFLYGCHACGLTCRDLGVPDFGGVVWDEIVAMLLVLAVAPMTLAGWVMGFVLFRFFDILKPWPIRWFDQRVEGGLGVMLDDLWAAGFAIVGLWFFAWLGVLTLAD